MVRRDRLKQLRFRAKVSPTREDFDALERARRKRDYAVQMRLRSEVLRFVAPWLFSLAAACASTPQVGSIGVVLGRDGESKDVFVREAPEGADESGDGRQLIPGDQLVMVDGVYVRELTTKDLRARLRGEVGSLVVVTVLRGSEVLRFKVKRTVLKSRFSTATEEQVTER